MSETATTAKIHKTDAEWKEGRKRMMVDVRAALEAGL